MIEYVYGDLFDVEGDFIMEQKNCFHIHGGLSGEMARRFPKAAAADLATEWGNENKLGTYEIVDCGHVSVINAYGQFSIGSKFLDHDTDYEAWKEILNNLRDDFKFKAYENAVIKIPFLMGCGLGGGSWDVMEEILIRYFEEEPTIIRICIRDLDRDTENFTKNVTKIKLRRDKMYTIVTGYHGPDAARANFFEAWWENTHKFSEPKDIFVINVNSDFYPEEKWGKWIDLSYNLGHVHDLDVNDYPNKKFCGWSMSFIMGAYLAYSNNTDFIYKEQDCLAFGDWVDELYSHDKEIVVGQSVHADGQALEQSLFLVRHSAILDFVNAYTHFGGNDAGRGYIRPESKFAAILNQSFSNRFAFTKMGYGRSKPQNLKASLESGEAFYIQKLTEEEVLIINFTE